MIRSSYRQCRIVTRKCSFSARGTDLGNNPLRIAIIMGSTRTGGPPYPAPLGERVGLFVATELRAHGHEVVVIDPREEQLELLQKPEFSFKESEVPAQLKRIGRVFADADAYVMCTPEYNHAPSPALLNILNHFGSSLFSFKPSAIVSYSAGQWGGTRAAHSLRAVLAELGCLPVSAMVHFPRAHEVLGPDGVPLVGVDGEAWRRYVGRSWAQLGWWAGATRAHRAVISPTASGVSPPLARSPTQRNAP